MDEQLKRNLLMGEAAIISGWDLFSSLKIVNFFSPDIKKNVLLGFLWLDQPD